MSSDQERRFVAVIMPIVERYAHWRFSNFGPEEREERTAEAIAACFVSYAALVQRGRESEVTPTSLAVFAAMHVLNGRHVGSRQESATDVLSRNASKKKGFTVSRFGDGYRLPPEIHEALTDNHHWPVSDQVAFRVDFPQFLSKESSLKQQVAELLAVGHRTRDVSQMVDVTPGRISQIRRELANSWDAFTT